MNKPFALIKLVTAAISLPSSRLYLYVAGYHTNIILHSKTVAERPSNSKPNIVLLVLNLSEVPSTEI